MKVLINDGIHPTGLRMLKEAGHEVVTEKIAQDDLINELPKFAAICVRSATKVRKELIDVCPNLKVIGRGGVGLDNIDVDYAREKGIQVVNTPAASSRSVAELAFAHMLSMSRFLHLSTAQMKANGDSEFKSLKKSYSAGNELAGKTLGVIGMGRIGQEAMKIGIGMGMELVASDPFVDDVDIVVGNSDYNFDVKVPSSDLDHLLSIADYITIHVPGMKSPLLTKEHFAKIKEGAILINAARGGVVDEDAMLEALDSGKLAAAALDVFVGEPNPRKDILSHPKVVLSPHIGASTHEAQEKIGIELAEQLIDILK